ncbi:hypothetical protein M670_03449 [Schinkia azotoformans MEV2011]|uniref:Uncharacterized protein n=1 Tax=Schinkia azotoformans MEV2011 TaxID=1348973 RepID=A0A072NIS3_SCHAZ|nr:hypothetical protein M670_03449 [Schinkia azotoformans MEV2011]
MYLIIVYQYCRRKVQAPVKRSPLVAGSWNWTIKKLRGIHNVIEKTNCMVINNG